jgi:hypothetical protein
MQSAVKHPRQFLQLAHQQGLQLEGWASGDKLAQPPATLREHVPPDL